MSLQRYPSFRSFSVAYSSICETFPYSTSPKQICCHELHLLLKKITYLYNFCKRVGHPSLHFLESYKGCQVVVGSTTSQVGSRTSTSTLLKSGYPNVGSILHPDPLEFTLLNLLTFLNFKSNRYPS